jgi:phage tail-like protein
MPNQPSKPAYLDGYPVVFHFSVTGLGGDSDVRFQEVTGLSVEVETEPVKEGGENRYTHILPVRTKYTNLTLKRAILNDSEIINWCKNAIENFDFKPKDIVIKLLNEKHEATVSWNIVRAYPIKWTFSNLDATKNELLLETLTLSYSYFIFNK